MQSCYAARVKREFTITIIGAGRLGSALGIQLKRAGHSVDEIVAGPSPSSVRSSRALAKKIGSRVSNLRNASLRSKLVWLCVPDREIARTAQELAPRAKWNGKIAFHSSGALPSDNLSSLRLAGASVAAVHPFMTFIPGSTPSLEGVAFAVEGDPIAVRAARKIVASIGGVSFLIKKQNKAAYHAWGGFSSPLLVALLVTGEQAARAAGIPASEARRKMMPIVRQTISNYEKFGPDLAFTGPLVRGDAGVVSKHLALLRKIPAARGVYLALARSAVKSLKVRNGKEFERILK